MKQFFKFMFASMLGFFLCLAIIILILIGIIASIATFADKETVIGKNTVLVLRLDQPIPERSADNPFSNFSFTGIGDLRQIGLDDVLKNIKKAEKDPNISGIYLEMSDMPSGIATAEAIRNGLLEFKKSGKFIISYGDMYSQKAYYLASVADKVYLNPQGDLMLKGLNGEVVFLKGSLQKLGIDAQIIRHGKYKSAVEPFIMDKMSSENREQTEAYVKGIWASMAQDIADSRKLSEQQVNDLADKLIDNAEAAMQAKLVDSLLYKDGLLDVLRKKLGIASDSKISTVTISEYDDVVVRDKEKKSSSDRIAVIYASGSVVDGEGTEDQVGGDRISRAIRKARLDKKVKAIVLRVNSPGGSALASEVILHEILLAKKEKPVVASFGDVAASGGYYIACGASSIIAETTTLTGSIGVLGIIPNFRKMMNEKLGITFDEVNTNENSDFVPVTKPMSEYHKAYLTRQIEEIYQTFIGHVSAGRDMTLAEVDSIGQGRVWGAQDAKKIGLIDAFGGLDKAIETAATLAKIKDYRVTKLPEVKEPFQQLMDELQGKNRREVFLKEQLGGNYRFLKMVGDLKEMKGIQARLPFEIVVQ